MEPNSTQAVKADPSVETKPVKRRKRGDTREDGMVFWQKHPECCNGEYWITPEKFADKNRKRVEAEANRKSKLSEKLRVSTKKLRCGDTRGDGCRFWRYGSSYAGGEWWMTPEQFAAKKSADKAEQSKKKADLSARRATSPVKLRCGDVRKDGMVFWSYNPCCANGEHWLTPDELAANRTRRNARLQERRATDPLFALKDRLRSRVNSALSRKGFKKNTKTALLLGCAYEEFKAYTEARLPLGMTWETFLSDGHLDHLVPLDAAKTEEDVYSLNHYTNLRPMWGPDNISKSAKLPANHELPDNLHPKVREIWERARRG